MAGSTSALERKVEQLEQKLQQQAREHANELAMRRSEIAELKKLASGMLVVGRGTAAEHFAKKAEWTITDYATKAAELEKGQSLWSPKFKAAGLDGMQLEFFPKGREEKTIPGFCSLFLWAPSGTKIKFQLFVGNALRAPDEEDYNGRIGHGHSNFCPLAGQIDKDKNAVCVGVNILDVKTEWEVGANGLKLYSRSLESMVSREIEVVRHTHVDRVVWKIKNFAAQIKELPKGASMWSPIFTAAGIREIMLEFYPNGSTNTTKEGYCAFYIRCPEGVSMVVTLFVGEVRKGPIKTTFDCLTGKGLPDFCLLKDQIGDADELDVGIEVTNQPTTTLKIESGSFP